MRSMPSRQCPHGTTCTGRDKVADKVFITTGGAHAYASGGGYDFVSYQNAPGPVGANLASGQTNPGFNGFGGTDSFIDIKGLFGSGFDDYLVGNGFGFTTLVGLGGNDNITGFGDDNTTGYQGARSEYVITADADGGSDPSSDDEMADVPAFRRVASATERLRSRDFAQLTPTELRNLATLMRQLTIAVPPRHTRRYDEAQYSKARRAYVNATP